MNGDDVYHLSHAAHLDPRGGLTYLNEIQTQQLGSTINEQQHQHQQDNQQQQQRHEHENSNPTGRGDFGGIDNEALDFSQLEDYINDDDNTNIYHFPESLVNSSSEPKVSEANQNLKSPSSRPLPPQQPRPPTAGPPLLYTLTSTYKNGPTNYIGQPHPLPESPPDSGSEPPFSPADDGNHGKIIPPSTTTTTPNLQEMLMQPPPPPLLSYSNTHPLKHLPDGLTALVSHSNPSLVNPPPSSVVSTTLSMPVLQTMIGSGINHSGTHQSKKRKLSDSSTSTINSSMLNGLIQIKQEPGSHPMLISSRHCVSPDPGSNQSNTLPLSDEDYSFDFSSDPNLAFMDTSYQCIRFQPFQQQTWNPVCDCNLKELPTPNYRVDADKGFNFSNADDAFVCQKKNHFQVTVHVQLVGEPHYIKTPEGLKKIDNFYLHFSGVKMESPSQSIKVEQSQSDRSKKAFHPVQLEFNGEQVTKLTVGRLHFSETTSNNMRKKGKPNPDQRYFHLVVALHAHCGDSNYVVISHASERIIVRASNPGQFENDVELCWQKGHIPDSIYHAGRVGINTDKPDESLVVHGNLKLTGHIMQPSDIRAKENIQEVDTKEQLRNLQQLRIVRYHYKPDFAHHVGLIPAEQTDMGIIAQEVQKVIPEAVKEAGDIILPNGQHINNFLVVNKERIFMENVGAVKELCKVTDNLENRIDELERMNRKLSKLKRIDSLKSISSGSTVISHASSIPASTASVRRYHHHRRKMDDHGFCSNRIVQTTIAVLIIIMALCLIAMATLYILEWQSRHINSSTQLTAEMPLYSSNTSSTSPPKLSITVGNSSHNVLSVQASTSAFPVNRLPTSSVTSSTMSSPHKPIYTKKKLAPIGKPKNCVFSSGRSACPVFCCEGNSLTNTNIHKKVTVTFHYSRENNSTMLNIPTYHLEQATLSPQPSQVLENDPPYSEIKDDTSIENSPYENVQKNTLGETNAQNDDDDNGHKHHLTKRDGKQRIPLSSIRSEFSQVYQSVFIPELNVTIGNEFAVNDQWSASDNHSYNIPISQFMANKSLTLQFQFTSTDGVIIDLCQTTNVESGCNVQNLIFDPDVRKEGENASWSLPIGYFIENSYKFRLPNRGLGHQEACNQPVNALGSTFIEFNFYFHRKCENM